MATFGKTTNGTGQSQSSSDRKKVSSAVPSTSGLITSITIRGRVTVENTVIKGLIYADSAGAPGALLAVSDEITVNSTTEQEWTGNFSGANRIGVASGTTYWIGWIQQDPGTGFFEISRDNTAGASQTNTDTYSDGPTNPFGAPTAEAGPVDVYVTYTETVTRRFYLANAAPGFVRGSAVSFWDDDATGLSVPHKLGETAEGASASTAQAETSAAAGWLVLLGQWTSAPASAPGSIIGAVYAYAAMWLESHSDANLNPTLVVYTIDGTTGAFKDEAISQFSSAHEFPTGTPAGISYTENDDLKVADFVAGDRVVLELGYRTGNADATSYTGTLYYGGTGSALADGVTDQNRPGWIDLQVTPGVTFAESSGPSVARRSGAFLGIL